MSNTQAAKDGPPAKALTVARIARLSLGREHRDAGCPGLYLHTKESGRHVWLLRYRRPINGRHAKLTLGVFVPDEHDVKAEVGGFLTPSAARALAAEQKRLLMLRRDPAAERKATKDELTSARKKTFHLMAAEFITRYSRPKNRRWRETARLLGMKVDKATDELITTPKVGSLTHRWRDTPVSELRKRDIVSALDEMMDRGTPYIANNTHVCLARMFSWLVERDVLEISPMNGLKKPHTEESRDRVLTENEIRAFWAACHQLGDLFGPMFQLLLVTAARRDEVRAMSFAELTHWNWVIPAARTKNKRDHLLPLPQLAMQLIGRIKKGWVFTTNNRKPASGVSKAKARLDKLMLAELRKRDPKAELPDWRLHDLRRTAATGMARLNIQPHVVEAVLNHATGIISGVAAVYNLHSYENEKRDALNKWAADLLRIVDVHSADDPTADGNYVMAIGVGGPKMRPIIVDPL